MLKTIRSNERKLLYSIINKLKDVESEINEKHTEKIQKLESLVALIDTLNSKHEETKLKMKEIVCGLKSREFDEMIGSEAQYLETLSLITEKSVRTLVRLKQKGSINEVKWNIPGKKRPHPLKISLNNFEITAIRNKINEYYCVKKQVSTLRSLHIELKNSIMLSGCRETLSKILHNNGFEFKNNQNEKTLLIERYEIGARRHRFLRGINEKHQEGKLIIYPDETYVHQNYKVKKSWQGTSTSGVVSKISTGKRHIFVHAGSEEGFLPGALLVFSSKSKYADYQDDMNSVNFMKFLNEKHDLFICSVAL